jgi:PAB-dependent poly(A)-specific ribonuclease subunit 3
VLSTPQPPQAVAAWAPVANHPGVAGLREAFVSDELAGAPALFLAYDYHPGAATLEAVHLAPPAAGGTPAPEATLWSYLAQLLAALRAAHAAGLALRPAALHSSKVLLAAPGRVRLAAAGAADALAGAPPADLAAAQRADLAALGRLLLELGCGAAPPALDALAERGASRDLVRALAGLLAAAEGSGFASAEAAAAALGGRLLAALDAAHVAADAATEALGREAENGRLLRLAVKLAMVCERAEVGGDTRWSETGDRYLLQLFRDFAFHQVDSAGRPVVDWGWVVEALNKADAGAGERVLLLSRDGASMLVVSYADVRRCLAASYDQLKAAAAAAAPAAGGGAGGSGDAPWRQY